MTRVRLCRTLRNWFAAHYRPVPSVRTHAFSERCCCARNIIIIFIHSSDDSRDDDDDDDDAPRRNGPSNLAREYVYTNVERKFQTRPPRNNNNNITGRARVVLSRARKSSATCFSTYEIRDSARSKINPCSNHTRSIIRVLRDNSDLCESSTMFLLKAYANN